MAHLCLTGCGHWMMLMVCLVGWLVGHLVSADDTGHIESRESRLATTMAFNVFTRRQLTPVLSLARPGPESQMNRGHENTCSSYLQAHMSTTHQQHSSCALNSLGRGVNPDSTFPWALSTQTMIIQTLLLWNMNVGTANLKRVNNHHVNLK